MNILSTSVSDETLQAIMAKAERERLSVDDFLHEAIMDKLQKPALGLTIEERKARFRGWDKFQAILDKVPDGPVELGDEKD